MKTNTHNLTWFVENITLTRFRHWCATLLLVLICFGMNDPSQGAVGVAPFQAGTRVRTISQSAIYLAPPYAGQFITTELPIVIHPLPQPSATFGVDALECGGCPFCERDARGSFTAEPPPDR